jgi:hypothetical protein
MKPPLDMVMIERATGRTVGPAIPFKCGDFFYKMPKLDLSVWHYMEFWKFERLINEKNLYFCRSDKLEDDMEGKYAEANRKYITAAFEKFLKAYPIRDSHEHREMGNEGFRRAVFISCWHLNRTENMAMWNRFTKTECSVVLRTTVRKLLQSVSDLIQNTNKMELTVIVSKVTYASQNITRPEWSNYGPFFYKDTKYMDEREFRLITHPPESHSIDEDKDVGQTISIDPTVLIEQVVIHPRAPIEFKNQVKNFLQTAGIRIPVSKSTLPSS